MSYDLTFADGPLPPQPAAGLTPASPPIAEPQAATARGSARHAPLS